MLRSQQCYDLACRQVSLFSRGVGSDSRCTLRKFLVRKHDAIKSSQFTSWRPSRLRILGLASESNSVADAWDKKKDARVLSNTDVVIEAARKVQDVGDAVLSLVDRSQLRTFFHILQFTSSVLFVVLYVWSTYSAPATFSLRHNLDILLCIVFGAEYVWRLKSEVAPFRSMFTLSNLCDLLAFLPPLVEVAMTMANMPFKLGRFDMRWFKLLRGVRVMRLGLLASEYRSLNLTSTGTRLLNSAANVRLVHLVGSVAMLLFVASTLVHVVEQIPWHEALYFVTTTLTTVGYGDVVVHTMLGRVVVLALICMGVVVIPVQAGLVYNQLVNRRMLRGPLPDARHPTVLVSTRLIEVRGFSDFFSEFFHALNESRFPNSLRMMVMCGNKPSYEFMALQELHEKRITLVEGTPLSEKDLVGARAERVMGCLLMADRFSTNPMEEDRSIQFQVWALKSYTKHVPLYVQVLGSTSVDRIAPFLDPEKDVIVSLEQTRHRLLALSCLCPGASTLIGNLLRSANVPSASHYRRKLAGRHWLRSYVNGCTFKIFEAKVGPALSGHEFVAVVEWLYRVSGCVLVGMIGSDKKVILNPDRRRISPQDVAVVVAISQQEAEAALRKPYTPPPHSNLAHILADRIKLQVSPEEDYFMQPEPQPDEYPCQPADYGGEWESESMDDGELPCVPVYEQEALPKAQSAAAAAPSTSSYAKQLMTSGEQVEGREGAAGDPPNNGEAGQVVTKQGGAFEAKEAVDREVGPAASAAVPEEPLDEYLKAFAAQQSTRRFHSTPLHDQAEAGAGEAMNVPIDPHTSAAEQAPIMLGALRQSKERGVSDLAGNSRTQESPAVPLSHHQPLAVSAPVNGNGNGNANGRYGRRGTAGANNSSASEKSINGIGQPQACSRGTDSLGRSLGDVSPVGPSHAGSSGRNGSATGTGISPTSPVAGPSGRSAVANMVSSSAMFTANGSPTSGRPSYTIDGLSSNSSGETAAGVVHNSLTAQNGSAVHGGSTQPSASGSDVADDALADLRGHVIVCGSAESFLKFIRQLRKSYASTLSVVVLNPSHPEDWPQVAALGPVYYVQGTPSENTSLRAARAFAARALVFLTHPRHRPQMENMAPTAEGYHAARSRAAVLADADALLTCYGVGEESGMERLHSIVELTFTSSVRFLQPGLLLRGSGSADTNEPDRREAPRKSWVMRKKREAAAVKSGLAEWQANPYYCAGRISVPAMMDTFACQCFFNNGMLVALMEELCGDDGRPGGAMLRQIHLPGGMSGKTYGELFMRLVLGRNVIPLGLFRRKSENPSGRLHYVMTNPRFDVTLEATDRVFVLRQRGITWMSDDMDHDVGQE